MDFKSKLLNEAVEQMSSLPGIGKRSALRLVLHLLKSSDKEVNDFTNSFKNLKENVCFCNNCFHISETELCEICSNTSRKSDTVCVVQDVRDLLAIESTEQFYGQYHVLGGIISPMEGVGPDDLKIRELIERVEKQEIKEIILALPATMEGDTTNFYIYRKMQDLEVTLSLISRGIGIGNQLEYIDELTLGKSLLNRSPYEINYTS